MVAEAAKQLDREQPADDESLYSLSVSMALLEEEKRLADIRASKEAKELAEEEECRRLWYEYYYCYMHNKPNFLVMRCVVELMSL